MHATCMYGYHHHECMHLCMATTTVTCVHGYHHHVWMHTYIIAYIYRYGREEHALQ